jgi:large subunit ribosomal protein L30
MPDQKKKAPGHRGTGAPKAKAAGKTGGKLRVTQVRSKSGRPALHKRTLIALGLRHHQQVIEVNDSPAVRGMLHQVRHLVEVAPAGEK